MDDVVRVTVRTIGIETHYQAKRETAERYARQMRRSVPGFTITIAGDAETEGLPPIPSEHLFREPLPGEARCKSGW